MPASMRVAKPMIGLGDDEPIALTAPTRANAVTPSGYATPGTPPIAVTTPTNAIAVTPAGNAVAAAAPALCPLTGALEIGPNEGIL